MTCRRRSISCTAFVLFAASAAIVLSTAVATHGAITWDGSGGTPLWFNPTNWSNDRLPPNNDDGTAATDTQINIGTGAWNLGEGVVYDPTNDPGFPPPGSITFPAGFGPESIANIYIARVSTDPSTLTIKSGNLTLSANMIVGRSSGIRGVASNGFVVQKGGKLSVNSNVIDLGQSDTGANPPALGFGNGTYDYRGGTLEVSLSGGAGLRFSGGTNSNAQDGMPAGAGGVGKFIMHNPASGGYVRAFDVVFGAYGGRVETPTVVFDPAVDPNGETRGVGIAEFHYENGATRPIQVLRNLTLNNGLDSSTMGTRSARIDLQLNSAVTLNAGAPINLGLFDVDFDQGDPGVGLVQGTGALAGTFSDVCGTRNLPEGATVAAIFGSTLYKWTVSYHGIITWSDADNSALASVTPGVDGTDHDVVLLGVSSAPVVPDADFDDSGRVDGADFLIWQRGLCLPATPTSGDANGDLLVDDADFAIWKSQFGNPFPATEAAGTVPEPGTMALAAALLLPAVRRRVARRPLANS